MNLGFQRKFLVIIVDFQSDSNSKKYDERYDNKTRVVFAFLLGLRTVRTAQLKTV